MDKEREIRFLYPPLFLLVSLAWGLYLDPSRALSDFVPDTGATIEQLVGVIAAGGTFILVCGFLISAISVILLRGIFVLKNLIRWAVKVARKNDRLKSLLSKVPLFGLKARFLLEHHQYEMAISDESLRRIWEKCTEETLNPEQAFYAGVTFAHELLPKGIHDWLTRRWHAFNIATHSCISLVLAHWLGYLLDIEQQVEWLFTSVGVLMLLAAYAGVAWLETMEMVEFQSSRPLKGDKEDDRKDGVEVIIVASKDGAQAHATWRSGPQE